MSLYHLSSKVHGRNKESKKTAVSAAAYRNGERYRGIDGHLSNYKNKNVDGFSMIFPSYVELHARPDAETLWRSADAAELKKDGTFKESARSAREFEFSLMRELTPAQNKFLARDFSRYVSEKYGVACNVAFHMLNGDNPHAHMMYTVRKINADGTLGAKIRELDSKAVLLEARTKWAELATAHLQRAGFDIVLSEKSFAEQGIEHEPVKHVNVDKYYRAKRLNIELPELVRRAELMSKRSANDDQYQAQEDVKKNTANQTADSDESTVQSVMIAEPVVTPTIALESTFIPLPEPTPSPSSKLHYEGLNRQEIARKAAEDIALLKMKQKFDADLRAIDEHYDRLKKLHQEIQNSKGIKVKRKFFGFLTLHVMKYKDADIEALKQEYKEGKQLYEQKKRDYERRMRASGIAVLGEHIKYVEENIDYICSVTTEKMINEYTNAYIDSLDNCNSNGSDFVYVPKANQGNTVTSSNDYDYNHAYKPDDHDDADGTNGPR